MQCCLSQRKNSTSRSVLWQKLVTPFLWPLVCAFKDQSFLLKKNSFLFLSNQSLYFGQLRKYIYFIITTGLPFLQRGSSNLTVSNIPAEAFPLVALHMAACYVSCHVEGLKIFRKNPRLFKVARSFLDAPCMPSIICALRICYALLWRISSEQQMNENIDNRPALLTFLRLVHRVSFLCMAFTKCQDLTRSQLSLRIRIRDQTCLRDCHSIFEYISLLSIEIV